LKNQWVGLACLAAFVGLSIGGCAGAPPQPEPSSALFRHTDRGTVVYRGEFEFAPPSRAWRTVEVSGGDEFVLAFLKVGNGPAPCQSLFAYDEEPFGYARDLDTRMQEFYRRFLWAARVRFEDIATERFPVLGGEGLAAAAEGSEPVAGQKVMTQVILGKRGERVVAFYYSQWRPMDGAYDPRDQEEFEAFARSFRFLKKSFYETLLSD
jgi:hypothetical protein